jgi:hypothetical protein
MKISGHDLQIASCTALIAKIFDALNNLTAMLWETSPLALHAIFCARLNNSEGDSASRVRRFIIFKCAIMLQGQQLTVHSAPRHLEIEESARLLLGCRARFATTRENFFTLQLCGFKFEPFCCQFVSIQQKLVRLPFSAVFRATACCDMYIHSPKGRLILI